MIDLPPREKKPWISNWMSFGAAVVRAALNDTDTAQAFAKNLPVALRVGSSGMDFCGQIGMSLPYEESQVHYGWKNGQVNYNPEGGWFAFSGRDERAQWEREVPHAR